MHLNVLQIASIIAIFQSVMLVVILVQNSRGTRTGNAVLSCMLIVFAFLIGCSLLISLDLFSTDSRLNKAVLILGQLAFLVGPLMYLYVQTLLNPNFKLKRVHGFHGVPTCIALGVSLIIAHQHDSFIIWNYQGRLFMSIAVLLQNLIYFIFAVNDLKAFGLTWKSFLSFIDNSRLAWVRFFIGCYVALWVIQLQLFVGWDVLKNPRWCPYAQSLYFLTAFFFFNGMIYLGLRKPYLFSQSQKYYDSPLKETDKLRYREQLIALFKEKKIYSDSDLTLAELAQNLSIAPCYLSQIINESFRQNFRDFVNGYRVEACKEMLAQKSGTQNILEIAFESGFNSKSAFNAAFKKNTGLTPKAFKRNTASSA